MKWTSNIMEQSVFEKYAMAYVSCVNSYEKSIEEFETLIAAFKAAKDFESIFASPKISKENKKKMLSNILNKFNDESLIKFSYVIVDNSRERYICEIFEKTLDYLYDKVGVKRGYIFTSMKLNDNDIERIENSLSKKLLARVKLKQKVDPSLIGGIKISLEDKVYDASLKMKLNDLKEHLLGGTLNEN